MNPVTTKPDTKPAPYRNREKYAKGCTYCEQIKKDGGMGPSHDASNGCESGKREHCTCDTCW